MAPNCVLASTAGKGGPSVRRDQVPCSTTVAEPWKQTGPRNGFRLYLFRATLRGGTRILEGVDAGLRFGGLQSRGIPVNEHGQGPSAAMEGKRHASIVPIAHAGHTG